MYKRQKWGSITIPNAGNYPIYGNYIGEKKGKTYYYYDYVLRKLSLIHICWAYSSTVSRRNSPKRRSLC